MSNRQNLLEGSELYNNIENPHILVVDDEPLIREVICETLMSEKYITEQSCDGIEALYKIKNDTNKYDLIITDLKMPKMDGIALLKEIRKLDANQPVIVLTGHGNLDDAYSLLVEYKISDFFSKPQIGSDRLLFSVRNALEKYRLINELISITTELKTSNDKLKKLSSYDSLTGLYNRRMLIEYTQHAISLAKRSNKNIGILYFDLDDFKKVNDTYGHSVGDNLLKEVATRVKSSIRSSDILARIGGDEFALLVENIIDCSDLVNIAKNIISSFSVPVYLNKQPVHITSSIGIALFKENSETADGLIQQADTAMYNAKRAGRNCYMFFSESMNKAASIQLETENNLKIALQNDEFTIFYQPKVSYKSKQITQAEALIRWNHPKKGLIPPNIFIPIAEKSDLIIDIGKWVRDQVLQQLTIWQEKNFPPIKVSVNVSGKEFIKREVLQHLLDIFMKYQIAPHWLELEITEDTLIQSIKDNNTDYEIIRGMDVGLAIDDFGTGYCSLGYLKDYPFETLKIDKSFINNVTKNEKDASIVKTIIAMAHSLNMSVVAEGVETQEQRDFLVANKCDLIQGYFYCKPQPVDKFEEFVHNFSQQNQTNTPNLALF
ncbi:EAL domain-containing protein [Spartinivicinus poritis]|uniref:EAL domain-containing protein n=1 Tax=Spartinivicinus poritis TaxID=2994640 RepID=A0ABT5UCQ3_9GAMM|nr:EAL domain-containing protein [Spartinivicinus sp. A2-2]MDE1464155.1 EAL domain-containing protein [Spartinivicinus sp. A2-2]